MFMHVYVSLHSYIYLYVCVCVCVCVCDEVQSGRRDVIGSKTVISEKGFVLGCRWSFVLCMQCYTQYFKTKPHLLRFSVY